MFFKWEMPETESFVIKKISGRWGKILNFYISRNEYTFFTSCLNRHMSKNVSFLSSCLKVYVLKRERPGKEDFVIKKYLVEEEEYLVESSYLPATYSFSKSLAGPPWMHLFISIYKQWYKSKILSTESMKHRYRQTDRQTDRQTERQAARTILLA